MFRGLAAITLIIALAVLGPKWLMSGSEDDSANSKPLCDLLEQACQWQTESGQWQVSLVRVDPEGEDDLFELQVKAPADHVRMAAVLTGHSMYLGEYPVSLQKNTGTGVWHASFSTPYCSVDPTMTWRVELMAQQDTAIELPFDLVFSNPGKG